MFPSAVISLYLLFASGLATSLTPVDEARDLTLLLDEHLSSNSTWVAFKNLGKTAVNFDGISEEVMEHLRDAPIFVQTSTQRRLEQMGRVIHFFSQLYEIVAQRRLLNLEDYDNRLNSEITKLNRNLKGDPEMEEEDMFSLLAHKEYGHSSDSADDACYPSIKLIDKLYKIILNTECMALIAKLRVIDLKPTTEDNNRGMKNLLRDNETEKFTARVAVLNELIRKSDCGKKHKRKM